MAVKKSVSKTTENVKKSARKSTSAAREATSRAAKTAKESTSTATATARATRAAKAGRVEDPREIVAEADLDEGIAATAIEEADALHYQAR